MDTTTDPVQSRGSRIANWLMEFPAAQVLSIVVIGGFVGLTVLSLMGKTIDPTYHTTLVWAIGASVLHQGYKMYKGGQAEVDSQ
jgi:hypothetical protein